MVQQTVPVNAGVFRKLIRHIDAHAVPLYCFDRWTMNLAIESPTVSAKARGEFVINFFSDEVKYFDSINYFKGERRSVRCDYWSIVFARLARGIFPLSCLRISPDILGILGWLPNRLRSLHRASSRAERGHPSDDSCLREELTTRYHRLVQIWLIYGF